MLLLMRWERVLVFFRHNLNDETSLCYGATRRKTPQQPPRTRMRGPSIAIGTTILRLHKLQHIFEKQNFYLMSDVAAFRCNEAFRVR